MATTSEEIKMNELLNQIKEKAIADFKSSNTWYGAYSEEINGNKVQAYVTQQAKLGGRRFNSVVCNWYLNNKKSSLAKVIEAIS
jgi:hypothetical protein